MPFRPTAKTASRRVGYRDGPVPLVKNVMVRLCEPLSEATNVLAGRQAGHAVAGAEVHRTEIHARPTDVLIISGDDARVRYTCGARRLKIAGTELGCASVLARLPSQGFSRAGRGGRA